MDKVDADTDKKAAEVKEKEAADDRNVEEERRQKELEEARIAAELQEQEQAHLDADAAIREDDKKKRQVGDDKIKKQGRGCCQKGEKKNETDSKEGDSKES